MSKQNTSSADLFEDLLSAYGETARLSQFWTDHGSHGDTKLTEAYKAEDAAFAAVMKAYRDK